MPLFLFHPELGYHIVLQCYLACFFPFASAPSPPGGEAAHEDIAFKFAANAA